MPDADIDHRYDYEPAYLAEILSSVTTIAMVGASGDKTKFSYGVLRQLNEIGYEILPVTPNPKTTEIRGLKVWRSLEEIDRPVDMVDVFRKSDDLPGIAEEAIAVGAKTFWAQLGLWNGDAAKVAADAGLDVVMDRCTKIEHARFAGGLHLAGFSTGVISSKRR